MTRSTNYTPDARATSVRQCINNGFPRRQCEAFMREGFDLNRDQKEACERISPLILAGGLILIAGREGNGKTALACSYAYAWYLRRLSLKRGKALYFTMTELLNSQKAWYGTRTGGDSPMDKAQECGLLVLDELITTHESPHDRNSIRDLLNRRYADKRCTIILTNLSHDGIVKALDRPMIDRISDGGAFVELEGQSLRGVA